MQKREQLSRLRQQVSQRTRRRALLEKDLFQGQGLDASRLVLQPRRCGKAGCGCRDGQGHGPYLYRVKVSAGKRRLEYIPEPQEAAAHHARQAYEAHQRNLSEYAKLNREIEGLFTTIASGEDRQGSES